MVSCSQRKGKTGNSIDKFRLKKDKEHKQSISWRCTNYQCKSRCTTDVQLSEVLSFPTAHNHEPEDDRTIQRHQVQGAVKRKAEESVHERPLKMACTEVQCYDSLDFNDAKMLRQSIYRAKKKEMSNLPLIRFGFLLLVRSRFHPNVINFKQCTHRQVELQ